MPILPIYANLCQSIPIYANLCQSCQSMPILPIGVGGWVLLKPEARSYLYSALSMMVTGGGGGARSASIHDANGRGPRVLSHASLRMHALTVHPSARRSTRYACTHRSPMYVSPSMRCIHSRCEWPRLVLACTPRPSMHVSPLMRAVAYSTHAPSLPSYACDRIHRRLRSDLSRVLSYSGSWVWDFQIPLWL